jgi:peptidoglycan/xylan/chitin deacetylase (PgdA/CDA1 family)
MQRRHHRYGALLTLTLAAALGLAACGGASDPSTTATSPAADPGALAVVDPAVVDGITSFVDGGQQQGRLIYTTLPVVPGAEEWTQELFAAEAPTIQRFREVTEASEESPSPELTINWSLVGASPNAIGVRLTTTEFGQDRTLDGNARTSWWDPAAERVRPPRDLIAPEGERRFFDLLEAQATAAPTIDGEVFTTQIDGRWELLDSVAFTTQGDLWIEFGPASQVPVVEPTGLVVASQGLLSAFGEQARAAALSPSDPGLAEPTATPTVDAGTPTPTTLITPSPSRTSTARTTTPRTSEATSPKASGRAAPSGSGGTDCRRAKCVALTFDDGPVAGTADLLDLFRKEGVRATFFPVGTNVRAHPELIRRMKAEGHEVGNHTWSHPQLNRLSASRIRDEISRTNDAVVKADGRKPTLLRPPYGATNDQVRSAAAALGVAQILWSVDPLDWRDRNSTIVTQRVLANTRSGSIVLSHDIHATTRAAYPRIVSELKKRGFTFVTVSDLLDDPVPGRKYFSR